MILLLIPLRWVRRAGPGPTGPHRDADVVSYFYVSSRPSIFIVGAIFGP